MDPELRSFSAAAILESDGPRLFTWTAEDAAGNLTAIHRTITRDTVAPRAFAPEALTAGLDAGQLQIDGASSAV